MRIFGGCIGKTFQINFYIYVIIYVTKALTAFKSTKYCKAIVKTSGSRSSNISLSFPVTSSSNDKRETGTSLCDIKIQRAPAPHRASTRLITASLLVLRPRASVFRLLTAYDRLARYLPNCSHSQCIPLPPGATASVRITQTAVETFPFCEVKAKPTSAPPPSSSSFFSSLTSFVQPLLQATVILDVYEDQENYTISSFLVENTPAFLKLYEGKWRLLEEEVGGQQVTRMCYEATFRPRVLVPLMAVEWKMKRDVAVNLHALKRAAEEGWEDRVEEEGAEEGADEGAEEGEVFWDCTDGVDEETTCESPSPSNALSSASGPSSPAACTPSSGQPSTGKQSGLARGWALSFFRRVDLRRMGKRGGRGTREGKPVR